jgi:hypothetical protein
VTNQISTTTKLYRRIQDPDFSAWKTLRVDLIGDCTVVGEVYHERVGASSLVKVVECMGERHLAWQSEDGRLFTFDAEGAVKRPEP